MLLLVGKVGAQGHNIRKRFLQQLVTNLLRDLFVEPELDETGGDGIDELVPLRSDILASIYSELAEGLEAVDDGLELILEKTI